MRLTLEHIISEKIKPCWRGREDHVRAVEEANWLSFWQQSVMSLKWTSTSQYNPSHSLISWIRKYNFFLTCDLLPALGIASPCIHLQWLYFSYPGRYSLFWHLPCQVCFDSSFLIVRSMCPSSSNIIHEHVDDIKIAQSVLYMWAITISSLIFQA